MAHKAFAGYSSPAISFARSRYSCSFIAPALGDLPHLVRGDGAVLVVPRGLRLDVAGEGREAGLCHHAELRRGVPAGGHLDHLVPRGPEARLEALEERLLAVARHRGNPSRNTGTAGKSFPGGGPLSRCTRGLPSTGPPAATPPPGASR